MNIQISAIVPCYNTKKDILMQCISSILQQDFQNFEIIIVNDGCDSPYAEYLQEIKALDNRIRIINQTNQGVSAARNNGLKYAVGEYITFIDSDDIVVPYYFSEAYHVAEENDADYVVGCVYHSSAREPQISRVSNPPLIIKDAKEYKPLLINVTEKFSDGSYYGRGSVARIVKRSALKGVFFQENVKLGEDIIWNLDVIQNCDKIFMVQQIWYIYWENDNSITQKYNPSIIELCEMEFNLLVQRIDVNNQKELYEYCMHIGDCLYRFVFKCYYGNPECPFSIYRRYILFCELCDRKPWSLYQTYFSKVRCGCKIRTKCFLIKFKLLYWLYFIKDLKNNIYGKIILMKDKLK